MSSVLTPFVISWLLQLTNVLWKDAEKTLAATITLDSTCVCTKAKDIPWLATAERVHDSSMPALRHVTFFFFGPIRHVTFSPPVSHMYFYHSSRLSTPPKPQRACCIHPCVFPILSFCSLTYMGLMKSPPCGFCWSSIIRFAMFII